MNLCVCLDAMTAHLTLEDGVAVAAGVGALEFWDWRGRDLPRLAALASQRGVRITAFSGNTFAEPFVDAAAHAGALRHLAGSLEVAHRLGVRLLVAHTGYALPDRPREVQWEAAVTGLRQAGEMAEAAGVTLALEPLNSRVDHPGYSLDSLPDALRLLREVDRPAVRLLLDVYHMRIMHDDLLDRLPEALPFTAHVHVADVPGRREPGSGGVEWGDVMGMLRASEYRGAVGLECWPEGAPEMALRRAMEVLAA